MGLEPKRHVKAAKVAEARRLGEVVREIMLLVRLRFEAEFRAHGVTLPQLRLLKAVQTSAQRSAASIARECQVTPQTLHSMLARAVREGWILRGSSGSNRRYVTATLTPYGETLLQQGLALREATEAAMWRGVSTKAMRQARETLQQGLGNLQDRVRAADEDAPHPSR